MTVLLQSIFIGISILSLVVAGVAMFFARFRPFTPDFAFGQPLLGNTEVDSLSGKQQLVQFIVHCEIHNRGAKSGVIEDISIFLSSEQLRSTIYFSPHCFIKDNYIVEGKVKIDVDRIWSSILVPPHSTVNHTIWFLNMAPYQGPTALAEGSHRYVLKYRKIGEVDWVTALDKSLKLDAGSMKHIMAKVGNLHSPDTGITEARDKLFKKQN